MHELISFIEEGDERTSPPWAGYIIALLIMGCALVQSMVDIHYQVTPAQTLGNIPFVPTGAELVD